MAERILVRVLDAGRYAWIRPGSATPAASGSAQALAAAAADRDVIAIVPATDTLLTGTRLPSSSASIIDKALPFAVEDSLCDSTSQLRFAHAPGDEPSMLDVAVASNAAVDAIVTAIEAAGLSVAAAVPEVTLLPRDGHGWSILLRDDLAIVRTGERSGFAIEADTLGALLRLHGDEFPKTVTLYAIAGDAGACELPDGIEIHRIETRDALSLLAEGADRAPALNFHRGDRRSRQGRGPRFVLAAAALVLIALAGFAGVSYFELQRVEDRVAAMRTAQVAAFRSAFPSVDRIVDVDAQAQLQMAKLRGERRGGLGFLDAVFRAGTHAAAREDNGIEFHGFSYQDGELRLDVRGDTAGDIETYRNMLVSEDLQAELVSAESDSDRIIGRLHISEVPR